MCSACLHLLCQSKTFEVRPGCALTLGACTRRWCMREDVCSACLPLLCQSKAFEWTLGACTRWYMRGGCVVPACLCCARARLSRCARVVRGRCTHEYGVLSAGGCACAPCGTDFALLPLSNEGVRARLVRLTLPPCFYCLTRHPQGWIRAG